MAFTTADLTRIEKAIATGAKTVMQGGEMIVFDNLGELQARRRLIRRELGLEAAKTTRRIMYPKTSTGFRQ